MKTKSKHNRLAAVFLALAMLLTSVSFGMFASAEETAAGDPTYVLDTTTDLNPAAQGDFTDGESAQAGTSDFFTLYYSAKTKIDGSDKKFDNGYSGSQRINFGGKLDMSVPKNAISFTTKYASSVEVCWVEGGDDNRQITIVDKDGNEVFTSDETLAKNAACVSKIELPDAGTYFLGGKENNNYFFMVKVTEHMPKEYVLDTTTDLNPAAQGDFTDGESAQAGTSDFFTLYYSAKTKIDGSDKKFDNGYSGSQRINFGGKLDMSVPKNAISFTTKYASSVEVCWVEGGDDNRQITIVDKDGNEAFTSDETLAKNAACVSKIELPDAGTYFLGGKENNNYFFMVKVTDGGGAPVERGDWSIVDDPTIGEITQNGGKIVVPVTADVGNNGGDKVIVTMTDSKGEETSLQSIATATEHTREFTPTATGTYTFRAVLSREGEDDKISAPVDFDFILPLGKPTIASVTSMGGGKISLVWSAVPEAETYTVFCDGKEVGTTDKTAYTVDGLTVGKEYSFTVQAVRGTDKGSESDPKKATATAEEQRVWGHVYYGPSTNASNNDVEGDLNKDGKVTVFSEGGKGKIVPGGSDGLSFYYTAIPDDLNFTLRAKAHVDENWITYSNGQEGFGLLALDSLPTVGKANHWTNQYMLAISKIEYRWDSENNKVTRDDGVGNKYSMKFGVGASNNKTGITPGNLADVEASVTDVVNAVAPNKSHQDPLEFSAVGKAAGTYNIVGGIKNPDAIKADETLSEITDFVIEIQRNNTGYFLTYYKEDGTTVIGRQKYYEPDALSVLDDENIYVGFFAARNARATFSDVVLTTIAPENDLPAEERPVDLVTPVLNVMSASVSNSDSYNLMLKSNVSGTVDVSLNNNSVFKGTMTADELFSTNIDLKIYESNDFTIVFTPDPDQYLGEYKKLANADPILTELTVKYETKFANQNNLYVAPYGSSDGNGGPDYPLDIKTAVSVVRPGQTIVVMEGTYMLYSPVRIERGMDGLASAPIRMVADPEAASRPVFNFNSMSEGFRLGGNYWYLKGFDVTNSANGSTGFRVCGSNNTLDQINAYNNGNTGIQISAYRDSSDPREFWPRDNFILNCTSYNNADGGYEDADGFAAKLTIGEGNVFDGCVAYNNADDGWDLYAKVSSGNIGTVTIRNCIAYRNGILLDGTDAGNGNGFKMGGENLTAGHQLINCIAFENKADGITSNSCPDIKVICCTSYNNGKSNLNLYTNNSGNSTNYTVEGLISCGGTGDTIKKTATDTSTIKEETNHVVDASAFVSTEFNGFNRKADGTIDLGDFLKLGENAPEGAGADIGSAGGSTPSEDIGQITPDTDLPTPPSPPSGSSSTPSEPSTPATPDSGVIEFEHSGTDIKVTAPSNAFDNADEIKFNADPVAEETNDNQFTFDLNFTDKDGNKVQPKVAVTVKIPVPAALKDKTIYVYHVENDGKYTEISCKVENGMVVFTASSFSKYIITSEKLSAANPGSSTPSGEDTNPSTGAAVPVAGLAALMAGAAVTIFVTKRKRG